MRGERMRVTVKCPRCGEKAGEVDAVLEVTYSADYDEAAQADAGSVAVDAKVAKRGQSLEHATGWTRIEHTCAPPAVSDAGR